MGYIDYLGFVLGVCFFGFILLIIVLGSVAWICDIWKDTPDKIKRHRGHLQRMGWNGKT